MRKKIIMLFTLPITSSVVVGPHRVRAGSVSKWGPIITVAAKIILMQPVPCYEVSEITSFLIRSTRENYSNRRLIEPTCIFYAGNHVNEKITSSCYDDNNLYR